VTTRFPLAANRKNLCPEKRTTKFVEGFLSMPYTYLLQCADGSYYTGWTTDLEARLKIHNAGKGAKYTRSRLPVQLIYWEESADRCEAQRREAAIRKLNRKQKERLIDNSKLQRNGMKIRLPEESQIIRD
jgi:Predicted endonuclease containing a URI domain